MCDQGNARLQNSILKPQMASALPGIKTMALYLPMEPPLYMEVVLVPWGYNEHHKNFHRQGSTRKAKEDQMHRCLPSSSQTKGDFTHLGSHCTVILFGEAMGQGSVFVPSSNPILLIIKPQTPSALTHSALTWTLWPASQLKVNFYFATESFLAIFPCYLPTLCGAFAAPGPAS